MPQMLQPTFNQAVDPRPPKRKLTECTDELAVPPDEVEPEEGDHENVDDEIRALKVCCLDGLLHGNGH